METEGVMSGSTPSPRKPQEQYWQEMRDLKFGASYMQLYRDYFAKRVTGLGTLKAVASSVGIAGWAVWNKYSFVWAVIIAASQVADALKEVFPFTKKHKAASELTLAFTSLFIDIQLEWENIVSGRFTDDQVLNRLHKLRKLRFDAERASFPQGLAPRTDLKEAAKRHVEEYFKANYPV